MAEQRSDDLLQARRESAELIGLDAEHLSPADTLRCDMISALRIVIDSEQANVVDGGRADLGRLVVATEHLIKLLPARQLAAPESQRDDPRQVRRQTATPSASSSMAGSGSGAGAGGWPLGAGTALSASSPRSRICL
jgi:hypothetical protein